MQAREGQLWILRFIDLGGFDAPLLHAAINRKSSTIERQIVRFSLPTARQETLPSFLKSASDREEQLWIPRFTNLAILARTSRSPAISVVSSTVELQILRFSSRIARLEALPSFLKPAREKRAGNWKVSTADSTFGARFFLALILQYRAHFSLL